MENRLATLFPAGDAIIDVEELLTRHDDLKPDELGEAQAEELVSLSAVPDKTRARSTYNDHDGQPHRRSQKTNYPFNCVA